METTYKEFMEAKVKSWKDMKDRNVLRAAEKFKKKMRKDFYDTHYIMKNHILSV